MNILSHRGFWRSADEKNTRSALDRTIHEGFGTETDVRDHHGHLVVAHDPPTGEPMPWFEVVELFAGTRLPLAVNVKADGLASLLKEAFSGTTIDWFAFDMSGPETLRYATERLPFFTRHSDLETRPLLYDEADGVWLDAFKSDWFGVEDIHAHLRYGKKVCVVSPELHGRDYKTLWDILEPLKGTPGVMLCTDYPDLAREAFKA